MPDRPGWALLGAPAGLCQGCAHALLKETRRGTAYLRCARASWDGRLTRYPRLPVLTCPGFGPVDGVEPPVTDATPG